VSFSQAQCMFVVKHYLMSHSYLACQTDFVHKFPDSPVPNKIDDTSFNKIYPWHRKCKWEAFWLTRIVKWWLWKTFMKVCYNLCESLSEILLSKLDCHVEMYIRLWRSWSFILVHTWGMNWRNLTKEKYIDVAIGSETDSRWCSHFE
jgi:hypothetical protein